MYVLLIATPVELLQKPPLLWCVDMSIIYITSLELTTYLSHRKCLRFIISARITFTDDTEFPSLKYLLQVR